VTPDDNQEHRPEGINRRRLALDVLGMALFFALFLFLPAATWAWQKGWLFILVFLTSGVLATLYLWRVNPEVLAARINPHQGTRAWDKVLLGLFFLTGLATIPWRRWTTGASTGLHCPGGSAWSATPCCLWAWCC
jgi:hypothetical protein